MYLRTKIFDKKDTSKFAKPILLIEVSGDHAVKLTILKLTEHFFGQKLSNEIKNLIENAIINGE